MKEVGVIVGRFQVDILHSGHIGLLEEVYKKHDKVIVFLGISPLKCSFNDPLDYAMRCNLIKEYFDDITVLPILDTVISNNAWSESLDDLINGVIGVNQTAILYGGRDSFIKSYSGRYKCVKVDLDNSVSATDMREKISNISINSRDFRRGVIWGSSNQYMNAVPTVDVAIMEDDKILLCRKKHNDKFQFIGGFVDPGETYEMAAKREAAEESNLLVSDLNYIGSFFIPDRRYHREKRKITTAFFSCVRACGGVKASDDIVEAKWFSKSDLLENYKNIIEYSHHKLFLALSNSA